jgi:signal transduction histidine kinase
MSAEPMLDPRPRLDEGAAALAAHVTVTALIGFIVTMLWGLTGADEFWPRWVWFGIGVPLALHAAVWWAWRSAPDVAGRPLAIHAALTGVLAGVLLVLWLLTGRHGSWPGIALIGPAAILGTHAAARSVWFALGGGREQALTERVDELTRTRHGALEAQAAELRRVERDLHDGAQSRLVSLSMKLGMAEALLVAQPEVAALLRSAHEEARAAIAELRDLARGIAPPVLTDRGLLAAVQALAARAVGRVTVQAELDRRPSPVVESAVYFVVSEALTNAAKHAPGAPVRVTLALRDDMLHAQIADDGPGDADPAGSGLTGLRHRVEALDGRLEIASPAGGGTTVTAELPSPR